ncbi:Nitrile hydratase accessory protein [Hyella patelloides LEGE 07179]|uniref:Nitrile hydratase accessory protein n=1 Tax=Hyella patelloides LEGE 07179 TaxID=945734 RepID=A0A563VIV0_9CYAN|nr:nitrile hydratase accessory protein [Hyella patelloides]VEP11364.1 Nitrile hydratase accessory protein [Hyella patelloides LEGE 07179]
MQLRFEHFAATSLMGSEESPPRSNGELKFDRDWESLAFGIALALAKKGHYEWEDFRQELIAAIAEWESQHDLTDASWDYYQRWLIALERMAIESELIDETELEQRTAELLNCQQNEKK